MNVLTICAFQKIRLLYYYRDRIQQQADIPTVHQSTLRNIALQTDTALLVTTAEVAYTYLCRWYYLHNLLSLNSNQVQDPHDPAQAPDALQNKHVYNQEFQQF